jgi:hypothetical protein
MMSTRPIIKTRRSYFPTMLGLTCPVMYVLNLAVNLMLQRFLDGVHTGQAVIIDTFLLMLM